MARRLAGELSSNEEEVLSAWMQENPGGEKVFHQLGNIWQQAEQPGDLIVPPQEKVWQALNNQLDLEDDAITMKPLIVRPTRKNRFLTIAVGLTMVAAVVTLIISSNLFFRNSENRSDCPEFCYNTD